MLHYLILISLCKLSRNFFFESLLMEYFFSICSGPSSDCPKVLYAASDLSITVRVIQSDTQRSLMTARVPGSDWVSTGAHQLSNRSQDTSGRRLHSFMMDECLWASLALISLWMCSSWDSRSVFCWTSGWIYHPSSWRGCSTLRTALPVPCCDPLWCQS